MRKSYRKFKAKKIRRTLYNSSQQYVKSTEMYTLTMTEVTGQVGYDFQIQVCPTNVF